MERIFANLYRLGSTPNKRGMSHSYLLTRKEGNLLICHQSGPTASDIKEIKKLGGIDSQFICHSHDTLRDDGHTHLHDQFGCALHHHSDEKKAVRRKTKCPQEPFGDEGLRMGDNFEAHFFPACRVGHSVYRWKDRGRYFLFTSHAMYLRDDKWDIQCKFRARAPKIDKLRLDFVFPGYTATDEAAFYRLNDQTRKSWSKTLRARLKEAAAS